MVGQKRPWGVSLQLVPSQQEPLWGVAGDRVVPSQGLFELLLNARLPLHLTNPPQQILDDVMDRAKTAKQMAESFKVPPLTADEVAAVLLFVLNQEELVPLLQKVFYSDKEDVGQPFFPYLSFLFGAVCKLPRWSGQAYIKQGVSSATMLPLTDGTSFHLTGIFQCTEVTGPVPGK